jgi:hypothetical protein
MNCVQNKFTGGGLPEVKKEAAVAAYPPPHQFYLGIHFYCHREEDSVRMLGVILTVKGLYEVMPSDKYGACI